MGKDSILVSYTWAEQPLIQRFIQGTEGINMVGYQVRSQWKEGEIGKIWDGLIRNATLKRTNQVEIARE